MRAVEEVGADIRNRAKSVWKGFGKKVSEQVEIDEPATIPIKAASEVKQTPSVHTKQTSSV